jgi:2-polyprenyl-6-methoxyphenol hydroxylase-like FAD-dependent oxidoreductase
MQYDVAIVGASLAGCSAAIHYGRAGLRVALIERQRSIDAYKALCGHFILGGAGPTLQRLGLWDRMVEAGAATSVPAIWTGTDWVRPGPDVPPAISLRRHRLDPMIRELAASTPGVELLMGHTVTGLVEHGRRIEGVVARPADGGEVTVPARLVVGADGHRSRVAELAGVRTTQADNARFLFWGYYRGVRLGAPGRAAIWFVDPDVAVAVPTDDDLYLLGAFPAKARLAEFEADRLGALEAFLAALPGGPDLAGVERASKAVGTSDYPLVRRSPTPRPGLALVGDAATASDPVPAVGCCWAFRSAEWLADATIPALQAHRRPGPALREYRRRHRFIDRHDRLIRADARGRSPNPIQRVLRQAAIHDEEVAARLGRFSMRAVPVWGLVNPRTIARAVRVARRTARYTATDGATGPASTPEPAPAGPRR